MSVAKPAGGDEGRAANRLAAQERGIWAVIPVWNARQRLPEVLDALRGQVAGAVMVDNVSTDGTGDWLEGRGRREIPEMAEDPEPVRVPAASQRSPSPSPGPPPPTVLRDGQQRRAGIHPSLLLRVLRNPDNRGWPTAVNQGVQAAWDMGAAAVLILNDDALVQSGAVAALAAALAEGPRTAAATARLGYRERPGILNGAGGTVDRRRAFAALRGEGEADQGQYDLAPDPDYPSGAASLIGRAAWEEVGPFDEACYLYYEDVDWGLRAQAAGWRIRYAPEAFVLHLGSAGTAGDPARRRYYNVRNRLRFARRWGSGAARVRCWLETLALAARQPLRLLVRRRRRDASAVLWGIIDHLRGRYGRSGRFG